MPEREDNVAKVLIAVDGSQLAADAAVRALAILGSTHDVTMLEVVHLRMRMLVGPPGSIEDSLPPGAGADDV